MLKAVDFYINSFPTGGGCTVREAMAAGLPTLSLADRWDDVYRINTQDIGDPRIIASDPQALVALAAEVATQAGLRQTLGQASRQRYEREFDPAVVTRRFEGLLEELYETVP